MCGIQTYQDDCLIPPGLDSRAEDQCMAFEHCKSMNRCWDRWSEECPDAKLAEPYEWLRCSDSCPRFEYCDDAYKEAYDDDE